MRESIINHWPEYLIEASGLGTFMISACLFGTILEYPYSPVHDFLPDAFTRRVIMGIAMGLTAICIIYSPWGKQSGAHINPSVTLAFLRLGKVRLYDAVMYIVSQFSGAVIGVALVTILLHSYLSNPSVRFVVTIPGARGAAIAFFSELLISFLLMSVILYVSNTKRIARLTGIFAGILVALYIIFEAPLSGMSMNPARTIGSALHARVFSSLWIYFTAPVMGMLLATEFYLKARGAGAVSCAKLHHQNNERCIHCGYKGNKNE